MITIEDMSILIVDDMKSMRLTIRKMLRNLKIGDNLSFAGNGREALDILKRTECDLIILDWNMPVMNGYELLENVRNDKTIRDMPVIMVTARADRDVVSEVAETEIDGYLLKPLTLNALDGKIRAVVDKINNPSPATLYRLKARKLEENEEYEAAIEQLKLALAENPSASRLLRMLGLLHFKIDKNNFGEKCLIKAATANKQDIFTRVYLADYYMKINELEKAGRYYIEILTLSKKYFGQALALGEKLLIKGLKKMAYDIFSNAIAHSDKHNIIRKKVLDICLANQVYEYPLKMLDQMIKENASDFDMIYKAGVVYEKMGELENALTCFKSVDQHFGNHIEAKLHMAHIYCEHEQIIKADDCVRQVLKIDPENKTALELKKKL